MSLPKTTSPLSSTVTAFLETAIDFPSLAANTNVDVDITAPRNFKVGRPCIIALKPGQTELTLGLVIHTAKCVMVSGSKKIRIRLMNNSAAAIDEASKTFLIWQL